MFSTVRQIFRSDQFILGGYKWNYPKINLKNGVFCASLGVLETHSKAMKIPIWNRRCSLTAMNWQQFCAILGFSRLITEVWSYKLEKKVITHSHNFMYCCNSWFQQLNWSGNSYELCWTEISWWTEQHSRWVTRLFWTEISWWSDQHSCWVKRLCCPKLAATQSSW